MILQILFWLIITLILFSIFGYPISLMFIQKMRKTSVKFDINYQPSVSLLVSTYNEAQVLVEKIQNSLALKYPNLNIVVISDGSVDNTIEICEKYEKQIKLIHFEQNEGKNAALNKTLKQVNSEIVVFSDANTYYRPDAIKRLVYKLSDSKVGCVIGQLKLTDTNVSNTSKGESIYWKYEHMLKKLESKIGKVLVGNGGIFAVKTKLLPTLINDIPNDFQVPMEVGYQNYKVLYEPEAIAEEKTAASSDDERKRKIRIVNRNFNGFIQYFRKIRGLRFYEMLFHKVVRWFTGFLAMFIFIINCLLLKSQFYQIFFVIQILFYLFAILGAISSKKNKVFFMPFYITMIFYSAMVGVMQFLFGKNYSKWTPPKTSR